MSTYSILIYVDKYNDFVLFMGIYISLYSLGFVYMRLILNKDTVISPPPPIHIRASLLRDTA